MNNINKTKDKPREVTLNWIGSIDDGNLRVIISDIQKALDRNKRSTFRMYLHSYGGNVETSLSFYQWIKLNKIDLTVVGLSLVASSATVVFLAGSKRQCTSKTNFLFHRLKFITEKGAMGPYEMEENFKLAKIENERYKEIYKELGLNNKELSKIMREGIYFDAEEAKARGIVHEIIDI